MTEKNTAHATTEALNIQAKTNLNCMIRTFALPTSVCLCILTPLHYLT